MFAESSRNVKPDVTSTTCVAVVSVQCPAERSSAPPSPAPPSPSAGRHERLVAPHKPPRPYGSPITLRSSLAPHGEPTWPQRGQWRLKTFDSSWCITPPRRIASLTNANSFAISLRSTRATRSAGTTWPTTTSSVPTGPSGRGVPGRSTALLRRRHRRQPGFQPTGVPARRLLDDRAAGGNATQSRPAARTPLAALQLEHLERCDQLLRFAWIKPVARWSPGRSTHNLRTPRHNLHRLPRQRGLRTAR